MPFFRTIPVLIIFWCITEVFGQVYQTPTQIPPNLNPQPNPIQQPIRQMPLQTPPKMVVQNGIPIYQQNQNTNPNTNIPNQPKIAERTMPPGYGSPYPTGQPLPNNPVKVATTQTSTPVYGLPPQNQNTPIPNPPPSNQPVGIANQQGYYPVPLNPVHPATPETKREFVGRAEPINRIVPFFLNPQEQKELDEFLLRWEKYSLTIKRYDVDFDMFLYDETIVGSTPGKPYKTAFGYFKYIAKPLRFVYHVEGEWVGNKKVERDDKKSPHIFAEKIIIDEKSVFKYEYNAKTVLQVNVPSEMVGKGIADSPLPLIFGAKADEMKKRFSMKIVTADQRKDNEIWLQAKPLLIEDQQEFSQIEIRLDKENLRPIALKKEDINGKAFTVYTLLSPKINDRLTSFLEDIKKWFTPTVPDGWKLDVKDWILEVQMAQQSPATILSGTVSGATSGTVPATVPTMVPVTPQPPFGNQPQPPQIPPQRNEIPLYQPKY
ncbi:MAG: hypothetical protein LBP87_14155 [Planctomycetaceae bacterium]|jgi:TIGR03009 family protein|nr:hypothetical protein [Planctomycetaceae bacterium]